MTALETKINDLIKPIIESLNYRIYDVIYEKEGKENYLRVFIDNDKGIDINDCEKVNNAINDILDEKDPIKNQYILEVSSPGIEKRLRTDDHLNQSLNKKIEVHTFDKVDNSKTLIGILKEFNEDKIILEIENRDVEISKKNISIMKIVFDW